MGNLDKTRPRQAGFRADLTDVGQHLSAANRPMFHRRRPRFSQFGPQSRLNSGAPKSMHLDLCRSEFPQSRLKLARTRPSVGRDVLRRRSTARKCRGRGGVARRVPRQWQAGHEGRRGGAAPSIPALCVSRAKSWTQSPIHCSVTYSTGRCQLVCFEARAWRPRPAQWHRRQTLGGQGCGPTNRGRRSRVAAKHNRQCPRS